MCRALHGLGATKDDYASISRMLNVICFDKHGKELRQNASPEQLEELSQLEKNITFAIDNGLINSVGSVKVFITNYLIKKKTV
jgi:glutathionyl-hydroquinone reductase